MSNDTTYTVECVCRCGGILKARGRGTADIESELRHVFWLVHLGDDHVPVEGAQQ